MDAEVALHESGVNTFTASHLKGWNIFVNLRVRKAFENVARPEPVRGARDTR
jgi:hypothetical protein